MFLLSRYAWMILLIMEHIRFVLSLFAYFSPILGLISILFYCSIVLEVVGTEWFYLKLLQLGVSEKEQTVIFCLPKLHLIPRVLL